MSSAPRTIVLGGGLAGTLAAVAAARHSDHVTIIERDDLPDSPAARPGVPQAKTMHFLWSGGARAIEELLPGTTEKWLAAGANRIGCPEAGLWLAGHDWLPRVPSGQFLISCRRDLLDWVIRQRALAHPRISVCTGTHAVGLTGNTCRVTGARVHDRRTGAVSEMTADWVIDATGRGSRAVHWLTGLGLPKVRETTRHWNVTYATQEFHRPPGASRHPLVYLLPDFCSQGPPYASILTPIENNQWHVALLAPADDHESLDDSRFLSLLRRTRHPLIADLIADTRPAGPVHAVRGLRWRHRPFGQGRLWPDGFVVLGDAAASYNPVLAQGMSLAARSALALAYGLGGDHHPGSAHAIQRAVNRLTRQAWTVGEVVGLLYDSAKPNPALRFIRHSHERLMNACTSQPALAAAVFEVLSSSKPLTRILTPRVAAAALLGRRHPLITEPPFTEKDQTVAGTVRS